MMTDNMKLGMVALAAAAAFWFYRRSPASGTIGRGREGQVSGLGGLSGAKRLSSMSDAYPSTYHLEV